MKILIAVLILGFVCLCGKIWVLSSLWIKNNDFQHYLVAHNPTDQCQKKECDEKGCSCWDQCQNTKCENVLVRKLGSSCKSPGYEFMDVSIADTSSRR